MTKRFGSLVGTPKQATRPLPTSSQYERGSDHVLVRDTITFAAAPIADTCQLATLPWETVISPGATLYNAALGAGVTISVGDVTFPAALAAATACNAAGSFLMTKTVAVGLLFAPLWQMLGYADLATAKAVGAQCELLATIAGGAATGAMSWQMHGQAR